METNDNDVIEIDLRQLFMMLLNRAWLIILAAAAVGLAAFLYTKLCVTPMYRSMSSVYILNRQNSDSIATSSDVSAASSLTNDFKVLVKSRTVLVQTLEALGLDMTEEKLSNEISVENQQGTRILEIYVTDSDPVRAKEIADMLAEIASVQIVEIMEIEKVNIISEAKIAEKPVSPSLKKNVAMGVVAGAALAVMVLLLIYFLDDTFKTDEEVERVLGTSVLGIIPLEEEGKKKKKKKGTKGGALK